MSGFNVLLLAGFGGFIGAFFRVLVGFGAGKILPTNFAYATLFVNIIGSFLIGIFVNLELPPQVKLFLIAGICGGFTTFSSFSYESLVFLQNGEILKFGLNLALNITLCIVACYLGMITFKVNH